MREMGGSVRRVVPGGGRVAVVLFDISCLGLREHPRDRSSLKRQSTSWIIRC